MAYEASITVGSGINPHKKRVCPNNTTKERHLRGTAVVMLNPEDGSAGCSGLASAISVGTSTVALPTVALPYRRAISICNNSTSETLYIGFDPGVTTSTGWPLAAGGAVSFDINGDVRLYGVSSGANTDIRILELS